MIENRVKVSQTTEEIVLTVSVIARIDEILEEIEEKLPRLKDFYQDSKQPIRITGRLFTDNEMKAVIDLIKNQIDVEIKFDDVSDLLGLHAIKKTFEIETDISETKIIQNSLRSGMKAEYPGSLVICGDVNSGAEVIAGGNIMILGALRGLAHSRCKWKYKSNDFCKLHRCYSN